MIPRWALGIMGVVVLGLLLVAWEYKGKSTATARDNLQDASLRAEIARLRQRLHALNASSSGKPDAAQSDGEFGDFVHSLLRDRGLNDSEATVAVSLLGAAKIRSSKALLHANLRDLHLPPRALAALNASRVELELALTPSSLTRLESELAAATSQLKLTQQQLAATADNLAATSDSLASAVSQLNRTQRLLSSASQNLTQCRAQAAQAAQASTCAATGADVPFRFAIPTKLLYIQGDLGGGYGNVFTGVRAALFLGRLLNRTVIFTKPNDYRVKTVFESLDTSRSHQGGVFLLDAQTTAVIRAALAGGRRLTGACWGTWMDTLMPELGGNGVDCAGAGELAPTASTPGKSFEEFIRPLLSNNGKDILVMDAGNGFWFGFHFYQYRWRHIARGCPDHPKYEVMPQRYRDLETEVMRSIGFHADLVDEAKAAVAQLFGEGVTNPPAALALRRNSGRPASCLTRSWFHGGEGCERVCYQTLETCIDLIRSLNATIPASDRLPRPGPQIFVTLMVDSRAGEPRDYLFSAAEWATMKSEGLVIHFPCPDGHTEGRCAVIDWIIAAHAKVMWGNWQSTFTLAMLTIRQQLGMSEAIFYN